MKYKVRIPHSMEKRYEELKKCPTLMLNHDDILLICPDYFKMRMELLLEEFTPKEEIDKAFEADYKKSDYYKLLLSLPFGDEQENHDIVARIKDRRYKHLKLIFEEAVKANVKLCELIDYIGHYPETYPVPKEEEKKPEFEKVLDKYDISVRYYAHDDIDYMQISSNDIVRIIDKINSNFNIMDKAKNKTIEEYVIDVDDDTLEECRKDIFEEIHAFPRSLNQEVGKSKREEDRMYQIRLGWIKPNKDKETK